MSAFRLWIRKIIVSIVPETRLFTFKVWSLRWCGAKVGNNVRISSTAIFQGNGKLDIGDDVWIGAGCRISPVGNATIKIGSHCDLGPEVMILTGSHKVDAQGLHVAGKGTSDCVTIGDGCWLGARSMILPGVSLAKKTLVAAGSVVTESVGVEELLIAGTPAKIKKTYASAI